MMLLFLGKLFGRVEGFLQLLCSHALAPYAVPLAGIPW